MGNFYDRLVSRLEIWVFEVELVLSLFSLLFLNFIVRHPDFLELIWQNWG